MLSYYQSSDFAQRFNSQYRKGENFLDEHSGASFISKPTPVFQLPNILPSDFVDSLQHALLSQPFNERDNDLFTFKQSNDIKMSEDPYLKAFRETIYSKDFLNMMQQITGIPLSDKVDISGQRYGKGNHLLCHDDELEGRRIAFIMYMVDNDWSDRDGGTLDFFSCDSNGNPDRISLRLVPKRLNFNFFLVSKTSFHQVAEVLTDRTERVSIGGWFHIDPRVYSLEHWINPLYLKEMTSLAHTFQNEASVLLSSFFKPDIYSDLENLLLEAAQMEDNSLGKWILMGPANYRHFHRLDSHTYIPVVEFLKGRQFSQFVSSITGWKYRVESVHVDKFTNGSYTLLHDKFDEDTKDCLDLVFFFGSLSEEQGGALFYTSEKDVLLQIQPTQNSMAMALRDASVKRFVKYINSNQRANLVRISLALTEVDSN